jgi:hypothetical protein
MLSTFLKLSLWFLVGLLSLCSSIAQTASKARATEINKRVRTQAGNARIVDFNVVNGGPLHISFSDGTNIEIPLEKGRFGNLRQAAFEDVQLAEDGKHLGWLADYMICSQSYPCHAELVIYQHGQKLKYIPPPHGIIWEWQFVGGGKQVMVRSGFPHGDDTRISTVHDTETGREQVNASSPKKKAPQ